MSEHSPITNQASLQAAFDAAIAQYEAGETETALAQLRACLAVAPDQAAIWTYLGRGLRRQKQLRASLAAYRRAVELVPTETGILSDYSFALCEAGEFAEAIKIRRNLLAQDPGNLRRISLLAEALHCDRRQAEAAELLEKAEESHVLDAKIYVQRALARLVIGDWQRGLADFEHRVGLKDFKTDDQIRWTRWEGQDLQGKTIVILNEQGYGDGIFSARFLPALKARGAIVIMVAPAPLQRLYEGLDCVDVVRRKVDQHDRFDFYTYPMSIPHRLGFDGTEFPPPATFRIPQTCRAKARAQLAPYRNRFKIGMVWTGSTANPMNPARATTPRDFLPLAELPGVQMVSLYKGDRIGDLEDSGCAGLIVDACSKDADFADTAAVIEAMDLVVTTDTAVAHLAASLNKPVWLLLSRQGFWYYGYGDQTPWYPTMRLYHQEVQGDWGPVFDRVLRDLRGDLRSPLDQGAPE
jgi:hypothetical protein